MSSISEKKSVCRCNSRAIGVNLGDGFGEHDQGIDSFDIATRDTK